MAIGQEDMQTEIEESSGFPYSTDGTGVNTMNNPSYNKPILSGFDETDNTPITSSHTLPSKPESPPQSSGLKGEDKTGDELKKVVGPAEFQQGSLSKEEEVSAFQSETFELGKVPENLAVLY
jgi:hypothetical protein